MLPIMLASWISQNMRSVQKAFPLIDVRSNGDTFKVKPFSEVDAVIIGINKRKLFWSNEVTSVELALMDEGLGNREIALKLGRPEAGIRNLRYRQGLKMKVESEAKKLFEQRDKLKAEVDNLEREKLELSRTVEALEEKRRNVEAVLKWDELMLRSALANALTSLKAEKPELFFYSEQEQKAMLVGLFLKAILS